MSILNILKSDLDIVLIVLDIGDMKFWTNY